MSARFYVKRTRTVADEGFSRHPIGRVSYVGPIPAARAEREAQAWRDVGEFDVEIIESTPESRKVVREWLLPRKEHP